MYDLHVHTLLSDGEMLPIELIRRASVLGYRTIAIADHVDQSSLAHVIASISEVKEAALMYDVRLLCAVELTHIPPALIAPMAEKARGLGADLVVVHGETVVEPVAPGTNMAACACEYVDVLAHPGLITKEEADLAARNGIALEITSRAGHNRANGRVVAYARAAGARMVVNSDAHAPSDLLDERARLCVALGSGLSKQEARLSLNLNIEDWMKDKGHINYYI
ncbi:MAG: histidinol phosphate phosphatase domain-containing protein [Methanomicrobiales archaeon]|nr:histidinol phosphate phosphatase domain-containing protein [Methanomicrobiales archaeon]